MRARSAGNWIFLGLTLLGALLAFWVLAAIWLRPAIAAPKAVPSDLISALLSNYRSEASASDIGSMRFSIVGEINPQAAEQLQQLLLSPVPTATARDFEGAPPFTATHTPTNTPTNTPTPTSTPTPTRTPSRTPTRTPTEEPDEPGPPPATHTPTSTPTNSPTPTPADTIEPEIQDGDPTPEPGYLGDDVCAPEIVVSGVHVVDPPASYGMQWVKLKYEVVGFSGLIFSDPLTLTSGGPTMEGGWDAFYEGAITFEIDTGWDSEDDFIVKLYAKALDFGENSMVLFLGEYSMDEACDE